MKLPYSKESDIVIKEANRVARKLGQNFVGSEHFIVALASVADTTAYSILNENGLDIVKIIDALKYTLEPGGVVTGERAYPSGTYKGDRLCSCKAYGIRECKYPEGVHRHTSGLWKRCEYGKERICSTEKVEK